MEGSGPFPPLEDAFDGKFGATKAGIIRRPRRAGVQRNERRFECLHTIVVVKLPIEVINNSTQAIT